MASQIASAPNADPSAQRCSLSQPGRSPSHTESAPATVTSAPSTSVDTETWTTPEDQALQQHRAAGRIDELRKQRQVEHGDLGIDDRRRQGLPEQHAVRDRVERLRREAEAAAAQGRPGQPQQVGRARELDRVEGRRHGEQHGGQPQRRRKEVHEHAGHHADQREVAGPASLRQRPRDQVDPDRARRQREQQDGQREEREGFEGKAEDRHRRAGRTVNGRLFQIGRGRAATRSPGRRWAPRSRCRRIRRRPA